MDVQSLATASLLIPTVALGGVAWRARRRGRTELGLGLRDGGIVELVDGALWGLVVSVVMIGGAFLLGLAGAPSWSGTWWVSVGQAVALLVLFALEEVFFRGLLQTGLEVVLGVVPAVGLTAVLVALPYSFSPATSVLAVVGAVVANLINTVARWRTGRIWFGLGLRWVLNSLVFALGLPDAGERLAEPVVHATMAGPSWISGGGFGLEAGTFGTLVELVVTAALCRWASGRRGVWEVRAAEKDLHPQT